MSSPAPQPASRHQVQQKGRCGVSPQSGSHKVQEKQEKYRRSCKFAVAKNLRVLRASARAFFSLLSPAFSCSLWLIILIWRFAGSLPKVEATKCRRNRRCIEEVASLRSPKSPRLCASARDYSSIPPPVFFCSLWLIILIGECGEGPFFRLTFPPLLCVFS
jgi:hypothetical protein